MFIVILGFAQSPNWLWAKRAGGGGPVDAFHICVDSIGYVYVTGLFMSSTIVFDADTLTNMGSGNIFVVKYNASGDVVWARSTGGNFDDMGTGICVDANGNVYVTGQFWSPSIVFGTDTLVNNDSLKSTCDVFILKYDRNGNEVWAKSAGGPSYDMGTSISCDLNKNICVTGIFRSSIISFESDTIVNADTTTGTNDIFIVMYDTLGNLLWTKSAGGINHDEVYSVKIDASGNSLITGYFTSPSITFGGITLTNSSSNNGNLFIVKYNNLGNVVWAKSVGDTSEVSSLSVSVDNVGNSYITGYFWGTQLFFGSILLTNSDNTGNSSEIFVAKYDTAGNVVWARSAGGNSYDEGNGICVDEIGNVYIIGNFYSSSISFGSSTISNNGSQDIFVAKYSTLGNVLWAKSVGGISEDNGNSIDVNAVGNVYLTGTYNSPSLIFGSDTLINPDNIYWEDTFVAKLDNVVGIDELAIESNSMMIFPNPTSDKLTIQTKTPTVQSYVLLVKNIQGQVLFTEKTIIDKTLQVDLSKFSNGIYFLSLQNEKENYVSKIVIQK